jgi:DNA polymerase-3 subunit delta
MILKSYIVEQNIEILKTYQATLIYGQNNGIKDDIKQKLKNKNKSSEIIVFFEEEILKNKNLLYDNIINESLFNEKKIIFIHEVSDKILNQISECLEKENKEIKIYIFSDNLEKKSKLRNLFERSKNLAALPCYEDNERTLIAYVNKELNGYKGLSGEIINSIISNSNMNRSVIKNELIKIKNFFLEKKINKKETLEILNIKNNTRFDEIRDNALSGEREKINQSLSEINILKEDIFLYLNSLNYRIMKLQEIIKISEGNTNKYEETLNSLRPPIFWKDKPVVVKQLKKWNLESLTILASKISETEILIKKNSFIRNDVVLKDLIIDVTKKACSTFS